MNGFEIYGQSLLKVIKEFHAVCIVLYIGCSGPVAGSWTAYILIFLDTQQLGTLFCALVNSNHYTMTALFEYSISLACVVYKNIKHDKS